VRRPLTASALALCLALAAACADESDDDPSGGAGGGDAGPATVTGGLAAFPDTGEDEQVAWSDVAVARELAGLERPEVDDTQAVIDYVSTITGTRSGDDGTWGPVAIVPPESANLMRSADVAEFAAEVGWSFIDVDRFAERQVPPNVVTVLQGELDEEAITDALGEPDGGTWVAGDPDGDMDLDAVSAARPLGEPLFLAEGDGNLVVTRRTDGTGPVLDALAGDADGATLADDEGLGALGRALDAEGAYSALLVRPGLRAGALDVTSPEAAAAACESALPAATTATATGIADDEGPVLLVAHAHDSADAAEANAEAIETLVTEGASLASRQDYSEIVSLDGVEVTGDDGTVVVARLRPAGDAPPRIWSDMLVQREGLLSHC
jgi:hypothetical protein